MARPVWCRWCQAEDVVVAGVFPTACPICGNVGRWSTVAGVPVLERRKHEKRPRLKFATTVQDYELFLKRIKIKAE